MTFKEVFITITDSNLPWFVANPSRAMEAYKKGKRIVVLDFETNTVDYGSALAETNHIVLACWFVVVNGVVTRKHAWADEYELSELEEDIKQADFVVAHNAKFELQWLKRCGLELRDILVFDTMLAEWVIAGNRSAAQGWAINLDDTAKRYGLGAKLSLSSLAIKMGMDPSIIPAEWLLPYCYMDVQLCYELYLKQREILERDGLLHLALTRNLTCAVLADIEFSGCQLDPERVYAEYNATLDRFNVLEDELNSITGGINLSSPKQLREYLYGKLGFEVPTDHKGKPLQTKKGEPKTDTNTLALLNATTAEQATFLTLYKERNRCDSLLSKNLTFFKHICEQKGGVFYGVFNQGFTGTHRLSSSGRAIKFNGLAKALGVQLQNLPRQYKGLFTAHEKDWMVLEFDGSQLEFRVAADLGRDEVARDEIINGEDIHSVTARVLTDAGQPTTRQEAKSRTFSPLYGGMGKTPAEKEYSKFFKQKYSAVASTQQDWCHEVLMQGWHRNPYGMKFYWPGTKISRNGYIDNTTAINNYSIQGFATGEIIPIALVYFWHRARDKRIVLWNTIHDSVAVRVHEADVEECKQIAKQAMTYDVYAYLYDAYSYAFDWVPLGLGIKVAKHWGDSKTEQAWDVTFDGQEFYKEK